MFGALIVHSPDVAVEPSPIQTLGHEPNELIKARGSRILSGIPNANVKRAGHTPTQGLLRVGSVIYEKEIVLLLHDWYHRTAKETIDWFESVRSRGMEVCAGLQYRSKS